MNMTKVSDEITSSSPDFVNRSQGHPNLKQNKFILSLSINIKGNYIE